ncbi:ribosome silencing factor [Pseudoclavibacter sp. 13-3]|uniref:ribosome silencing factor n=1 Tax=Pseudoclavibacter sp. 13-3 TaxID=2901228 RepID=UPI001E5CEA27|nr:ribosome silencing factor [Pseudoclavibacter sp. 13-3]MCD7100788.1 ribosome silencing factor [Pseudoclavibacter sp. 13-3]
MTATAEAKRLAQIAAQAALDLNGHDIVALDVSGTNPFADIFVIVTGSSDRNVVAIADAVQDAMVENGVKMRGREGRELGEWVLQNFGDVVVHTFQAESRDFYALERIWNTAPVVELELHDGAQSASAR